MLISKDQRNPDEWSSYRPLNMMESARELSEKPLAWHDWGSCPSNETGWNTQSPPSTSCDPWDARCRKGLQFCEVMWHWKDGALFYEILEGQRRMGVISGWLRDLSLVTNLWNASYYRLWLLPNQVTMRTREFSVLTAHNRETMLARLHLLQECDGWCLLHLK